MSEKPNGKAQELPVLTEQKNEQSVLSVEVLPDGREVRISPRTGRRWIVPRNWGGRGKEFQAGEQKVKHPHGPRRNLIDEYCREILAENDDKKARQVAARLVAAAIRGNMKAIVVLCERTQGKPLQKVEMTGPDGGPISFNAIHEINARIVAILAKAGPQQIGAGGSGEAES